MCVLYVYCHALGVKQRHGSEEVSLVTSREVALYELGIILRVHVLHIMPGTTATIPCYPEGIPNGIHSGMCHGERLAVTLHASWHDHSQAHQCFSRMFSHQPELHGMACVSARQKFVERNGLIIHIYVFL